MDVAWALAWVQAKPVALGWAIHRPDTSSHCNLPHTAPWKPRTNALSFSSRASSKCHTCRWRCWQPSNNSDPLPARPG